MFTFDLSIPGPKGDNQDATFFAKSVNDEVLALVADGVGGSQGGRYASHCVRRAGEEAFLSKNYDPETIIRKASEYVNSLQFASAATTATVVFCSNLKLKFAHTGDTRAYILRRSGIKTLTEDQTEVALLLKEGVLTREAAQTYRRRNVLTHSIEKGAPLLIQTGEFDLLPGDRVILVSDGVYKVLSKRQISTLSSQHSDAASFLSSIRSEIETTIEDDASIVVIDV